jgi:integrase
VKQGLLDLVERRLKGKAPRLFLDLKPGGPAENFGYDFSRAFSKMIRGLGVSERTTFHSLRHTWRTILDETDHPSRFFAMMGGWARLETDEGSRTYAKRRKEVLPKLKRIIDEFRPPVDLDRILGGM